MNLIYIVLIVMFFLMVLGFLYLLAQISATNQFLAEMTDLVSRTFKQYYRTENIEPQVINNGYDLVWNPDNEDITNKPGFITIWTADSTIDSPIVDMKDADILGCKLIEVVEKHIQDRELNQ